MKKCLLLASIFILATAAFFIMFTKTSQDAQIGPGEKPTQSPDLVQASPGNIEIEGTMVCLPHRNTKGPQTTECAFGLKTEDGTYYGLRDSDPEYKNLMNITTDEPVTIVGVFTPKEDKVYPTVGTIEIKEVKKK